MEQYNLKIKQCGNIIRIHKYEKAVVRGYKHNRTNNFGIEEIEVTPEIEQQRKERRIKKLIKSKNDFIDIVNYNFTTKDILVTLTSSAEEDPEVIKNNFNSFIKKIKYRFGNDIKYCYVKLKQARGVYHYHLILNINYIDKDVISELWGYGNVNISQIKNVNAIATYMGNHINKESVEGKDLREKIFQTSRTCIKPNWIYGEDAEKILYTIPKSYREKFYKKYKTEVYGDMDIILYEK